LASPKSAGFVDGGRKLRRWDRVAAVQNGGAQPCSSLGRRLGRPMALRQASAWRGGSCRSNRRDWLGWMRRSLRGAEEFPIHAQGRVFLVGAVRWRAACRSRRTTSIERPRRRPASPPSRTPRRSRSLRRGQQESPFRSEGRVDRIETHVAGRRATVTGRSSNTSPTIRDRTVIQGKSGRQDLNLRPLDPQRV